MNSHQDSRVPDPGELGQLERLTRGLTENGAPISDCYPFRIRFRLKE
jgi:hypothetical protein